MIFVKNIIWLKECPEPRVGGPKVEVFTSGFETSFLSLFTVGFDNLSKNSQKVSYFLHVKR